MSHAQTVVIVVVVCFATILVAGCGGGGGGGQAVTQNPTPIPIPVDPDPTPDPTPNQSPSITSVAPDSSASSPIRMLIDQTQAISVSAADPDNDPLTYTWAADNGTITPSANRQEATFKAPAAPGAAVVTVSVSDGTNPPVSANVYFLIGDVPNTLPPNRPPTVTLQANPAVVAAGATSTLTASASDPDGDPLVYTWIVNVGQIQTDNGSSIVWKAPTVPGSYSITVSVSDNKSPAVQASTAVTVEGGSVEQPFTNGLTGRYYKNSGVPAHPVFKESDFKFERIDPAINFEWGRSIPHPDLVEDDGVARHFNIRWTGYVRCDKPGNYAFGLRYDDGARLFVGTDAGQLNSLIDGWWSGPTGIHIASANITLQGAKWYPIVVEYFEDKSTRYVQLYWMPPNSSAWEIVPTTMLRSD